MIGLLGAEMLRILPDQWLVSDLWPTVLNCPATICACHSGSRVTDRIARHRSQRNWRTGTVPFETSSRARSASTTILGTASHFGHFEFMFVSEVSTENSLRAGHPRAHWSAISMHRYVNGRPQESGQELGR